MHGFRWLLTVTLLAWNFIAIAANYDELKPLLIDLNNWQAKPAEGTNIDSNGVKMIIANRHYQQADKQNIDIQVGLMPGAAASAMSAGMNMETDQIMMNIATIDGFQVYQNYDKPQKSGSILVKLADGNEQQAIMFIMSYSGISYQDALNIAKQFDWKKMKTAGEALLK